MDVGRHARRKEIEPRYQQDYYDQLRAADARGKQPPPEEQSEVRDTPTVGEPAVIGPEATVAESNPSGESPEPGQWSRAGEAAEDGQGAKAAIGERLPWMSSRQGELSEPGEPAGQETEAAEVDTPVVAGEQAPSKERSEPGQQSKAGEPTENGQDAQAAEWAEQAEVSRSIWGKYLEKWPPEERPPVDRSDDPPGSWRSDAVRYLPPAVNAELEQGCDSIAGRGERILPGLREVERRDPDRHLVGLEHHLKSRDRIKEKVFKEINENGLSPSEALSLIPDALRYTFQYEDAHYTQGVLADIERMKEQGFKLEVLKNFWSDDQYKGVNSQWIEPETGQRFELQFHTSVSFEAKQITHDAYERLRSVPKPDALERLVLEAFQAKVTAAVPIPPGAADIPDYSERDQNAR